MGLHVGPVYLSARRVFEGRLGSLRQSELRLSHGFMDKLVRII